jgi:hypothetical protein
MCVCSMVAIVDGLRNFIQRSMFIISVSAASEHVNK